MNLSDVTILVTSFLRFGFLKECLEGIAKNLPECAVITVDDSGPNYFALLDAPVRRFIQIPFDSGLPAKRNAGVRACETKYILMGSDDFDFSTKEARDGILKLLAVLNLHPNVDVAGGHVNNNPYEGFLEYVPGEYIREHRLQLIAGEQDFYNVDLTVNYFLARTDVIRFFPWDERMKIGGEHGDWFLMLKESGIIPVAWVPGVNINELPDGPGKAHPDYGTYRQRARSLGHRIFLEKHSITRYIGFDE